MDHDRLSSSDLLAQRESGLWVPQGLASPPPKRLGEIIAKYATVGLTVATGLAYLLGVWSVAQFSKGVGASAADLGFDFRDYLVLAAVNLLPLAFGAIIAVPAVIFASRVTDKQRSRMRLAYLAIAIVAFGIFVVSYFTKNSNLTALGLALYAGAVSARAISVYVDPRYRGEPSRETRRVFVTLAVVTSALVIYFVVDGVGRASESYGNDLRNSASPRTATISRADYADPPYGLDLLINPTLGYATTDHTVECVLRIRANVVSDGFAVVVLNNVDEFALDDCDLLGRSQPADRPPVAALGDGITEVDVDRFNTALASKIRTAPGSDFFARAPIEALDLGDQLDDEYLPADLLLSRFDEQFGEDGRVVEVFLRLTGQELCPAHQNSIREYVDE